jgi:hypothetical protein
LHYFKLFARHDAAATIIDKELDNDLVGEEPDEGGANGHERAPSMSQVYSKIEF